MSATGYSGTPLAKKLGIKSGMKISLIHGTADYQSFFSDFPDDVEWVTNARTKKDCIHYFAVQVKRLENDLPRLKNQIEQNGMIWISWPKKISTLKTDLDGNVVREIGLACGLVDIKVCAVSETWSGLKFVIPVKNRK